MRKKDRLYTLDELEDEFIGKKGTPKRNRYETEVEKIRIGETIRQARTSIGISQGKHSSRIKVKKRVFYIKIVRTNVYKKRHFTNKIWNNF